MTASPLQLFRVWRYLRAATVAAPRGRRRLVHVACLSDLVWRIEWRRKKHACVSCPRVVCCRLKGNLVSPTSVNRRYRHFPLDVSLGPTEAFYNDFLLFLDLLVNFAVYGTNSPLISASLVRHSLLHFHLSHMAVHHLHHLHYHRLHLLLLAQYFILNSTLGSSASPFLHRPFSFLPDWFHGLSDHLMILLCSTAGFVCMVCQIKPAPSRFSNAL